ncbi:MAG: nucleotide exchange factor GrpE [Bacteroidetes bacterium]|nr:nucleotide exchange factor GrpE [Bacteroidota bacterium]
MDEKDQTLEDVQGTLQEERTPEINTDESIAGSIDLGDPPVETPELEKLREQVREKEDKYLRLYAEFDNFKRRNAKERIELIQTAGKDVIQSLLEVLDDCTRAERQLTQTDELPQIREGVQLVFNKFRRTLQAKGLKEMESLGAPFDPDRHEAITEIPVPDAAQAGQVIDVVEKGYFLHDKIIRFAKVVVGKHP